MCHKEITKTLLWLKLYSCKRLYRIHKPALDWDERGVEGRLAVGADCELYLGNAPMLRDRQVLGLAVRVACDGAVLVLGQSVSPSATCLVQVTEQFPQVTLV